MPECHRGVRQGGRQEDRVEFRRVRPEFVRRWPAHASASIGQDPASGKIMTD